MKTAMEVGENPMAFKKLLAFELTKYLNSKEEAVNAQKEFETRFQKGNVKSADLPTASLATLSKDSSILDHLVTLTFAASKSEARRLVDQHAVRINGTVVNSPKDPISLAVGDIVEAGRKAVKITK
jgi:tyrosyl-tRNA synthetase